jgi:hypothetical protein
MDKNVAYGLIIVGAALTVFGITAEIGIPLALAGTAGLDDGEKKQKAI